MNKSVSPTLIGAFVVGAVALVVIAVLSFSAGRLFRQTKEFVLYFDGSVNGLRVGAPVKFRGVEVGSVKEILLRLEQDMNVPRIPVIIEIDLEKIISRGATGAILKDPQAFNAAIDQGLRGQLQMESVVTGLLYIGFDIFPGSPVHFVQVAGERYTYQEIPTIPTTMEKVEETAVQVLAKLEEIDFKRVVDSLTEAVNGANKLVNSPALTSSLASLEQTIPKMNEAIQRVSDNLEKTSMEARQALTQAAAAMKQAEGAMKEAEATMTSVRSVIDPDSPTFYDLTRTLKELSTAARSLRLLTNYVERNPRSLIFGKPDTKEN